MSGYGYTAVEAAKARVDVEDPFDVPGEYITIAVLDRDPAMRVKLALEAEGIEVTLSCRCGSYEYGACELCTKESEVSNDRH